MVRRFLLIGVCALLLRGALCHAAPPVQILAVMYDGAEYAVVRKLYLADDLPHLKSIGPLSTLTAITPCMPEAGLYWPCQPTITAPQHATMLTGADMRVHRIDDNRDFKTPRDSVHGEAIPPGLTIHERLKALDPTIKTAYIRDQGHCLDHPILNDAKWANALWAMDDHSCGDVVNKVIAHLHAWADQPYFMIMHFDSPDAEGHIYGYGSPQYAQALRRNDAKLGQVLAHVKETARVWVFADHGFGTKSYGAGPQRAGRLSTHIHRDDATATFLVRKSEKSENWAMHQLCGAWLRYFGGAGLRCGPLTPTPRDTTNDPEDN